VVYHIIFKFIPKFKNEGKKIIKLIFYFSNGDDIFDKNKLSNQQRENRDFNCGYNSVYHDISIHHSSGLLLLLRETFV
jgi:hypothetical protein